MNLEKYRGIYISVEQADGKISNIAYELIGEAKNLAEALKIDVTAALIGSGVEGEAKELGAYGVDRVILVDDPAFKEYRTEPYMHAFAEVTNKYKPEIALIDATPIGRDPGPSILARVATGLMAGRTKFEIGDFPPTTPAGKEDTQKHNQLLMTCSTFGGNTITATVCPNNHPQMATVHPGVMQKRAKEDGRKFEPVEFSPGFMPNKRYVEIFEVVKKISNTADIMSAEILVSGGCGVGSVENFKILDELIEAPGGKISCSRAVVDANQKPQVLQAGQTGGTIRPQLYSVIGIPGVIQHLAGMGDSDLTIAIDGDEDAPTFDVANIGIVGDLNQIIPALTKQIANYLAMKKQ